MPATFAVKVTRKWNETPDICVLELHAVREDQKLPAFEAGAHVEVHLRGLPSRQYSLCNTPGPTDCYQLGIFLEPESRGVSRAIHQTVEVGHTLDISPPKNHFPLAEGATHSLLLAGGIGVTPVLAMAEALASRSASFDFHYCTRSAERMAFQTRIGQSGWRQNAHLYFDDAPDDRRLDLNAVLSSPAAGTHLYVCGPSGFVTWVKQAATQSGWPDTHVHSESFTGTAVEVQDGDRAFDVEIAETGQIIHVGKDQTALNALVEAGIDIPSSCEAGNCGTCQTMVVSGAIDHRDQYLTAAERVANKSFIPCCSRAADDMIVIGLE
ncbi:PDR/VanB family oxidoreductase [Burkholderia lata]|uniref:Ferredoxin n=1 Tax=Burkholderia lata (strain ATCC 17760 / DSM 23089 / LMG 22485 / NCIMB 9086 / R18194 / 383) TaxID=482957 RepID=Q39LN8_BURL3|nr:PDR/VanB family oxidoreductase [Burkholderia lata]ABB06628.1 Ferredoxin [Burkholderia lata]